jgi:hypothetical protein
MSSILEHVGIHLLRNQPNNPWISTIPRPRRRLPWSSRFLGQFLRRSAASGAQTAALLVLLEGFLVLLVLPEMDGNGTSMAT